MRAFQRQPQGACWVLGGGSAPISYGQGGKGGRVDREGRGMGGWGKCTRRRWCYQVYVTGERRLRQVSKACGKVQYYSTDTDDQYR
ncbi:hypothetical protein E2C01_021441 [Portunus trituberculatus]|uniref:Uncharacterized protein n=1 Tax=Portunus trituberculatus TaxID=210409 RepID=A0A5B7E4M9_PORTR|nr:hypothetical protein [Portunus trituberculatus]